MGHVLVDIQIILMFVMMFPPEGGMGLMVSNDNKKDYTGDASFFLDLPLLDLGYVKKKTG